MAHMTDTNAALLEKFYGAFKAGDRAPVLRTSVQKRARASLDRFNAGK